MKKEELKNVAEEHKKEIKVYKSRNNLVVKSNELIQKASYELSAQEQKILLYIISKLKPNDTDFNIVELKMKEFCDVCGITFKSGANYNEIEKSLKELKNKNCELKTKKEVLLFHWLGTVKIDKVNNKIYVAFDTMLKPYLLQLYSNFTAYQLENILIMDSKYSIRIYELLLSVKAIGYYKTTVSDLKKMLGCENKYSRFNNFRQKVLSISIKEINEYTDINVNTEYEKNESGETEDIIFNIVEKTTDEKNKAFEKRYKLLNKID